MIVHQDDVEASGGNFEGVAEGVWADYFDHADITVVEVLGAGAEGAALFVKPFVTLFIGEDDEHAVVPGLYSMGGCGLGGRQVWAGLGAGCAAGEEEGYGQYVQKIPAWGCTVAHVG